MNWILFTLIVVFLATQLAKCSGVFELRLKSWTNFHGKDSKGFCCNDRMKNTSCGNCNTYLKVCLKQYQERVDTSKCTFGDRRTPVIGGNVFDSTSIRHHLFTNPIKFHFGFTWPESFSLITEAWHESENGETNDAETKNVLLSHLAERRRVGANSGWTEVVQKNDYSTLLFDYRVKCDEHYYGPGCDKYCKPRDDKFGHYNCSANGDRVCMAGWKGDDYCSEPMCLPGCHDEHGHCQQPGECRCHSGWTGPLCDQCERYPGCVHGTCVKKWDCICEEGWGGLFCNQDLNYCTNHKPCRNNGTCHNTGHGSYTCLCLPGFTGTDCEHKIDICQVDNGGCKNGAQCKNNKCVCPQGWHGTYCESAVKTCDERSCLNGGTCVDNGNANYICQCAIGFTGLNCEKLTEGCGPNTCLNNGSCISRSSDQCLCPSGFSGKRCEINIDDCKPNVCLNGGTCIDLVNGYRCQCIPGFVGDYCKDVVDYCLTKPCANGGTCQHMTNDYKCSCKPGFTGKDCSMEIDECDSQPCLNNGKCKNLVNDYECVCPTGLRGKNCQEEIVAGGVSAQVRSNTGLTTEHVVVIATFSTFVPILVLIAAVIVMCLKQRRRREQARADEEARMQNEQNSVHSSMTKRSANTIGPETHMIKNSWGKCTNNVLGSSLTDDCNLSNTSSVSDGDCLTKAVQIVDNRPVYTLQRTRSYKQLNTETAIYRQQEMLIGKLHDSDIDQSSCLPSALQDKRLSVMSNTSSLCNPSDSLLKCAIDKVDVVGHSTTMVPPGTGVYVIEEHFHRPEALHAKMFATEV